MNTNNTIGKTSADLVVYGKIFTSENGRMAEAFAVKDGKYVYVGDKNGAEAFIEAGKTEVIDYFGTSSGTVIETETLDSTIAKLLDGLNAHVPSLNSYNLDYEVFYHYSVEEYVVRGYSYNNGSDLEAELYNVFSSFNGLECMNHDEYNTYEEYGYLFGNDEYGSEFFFNFCAIDDYFYIEVARIEGVSHKWRWKASGKSRFFFDCGLKR